MPRKTKNSSITTNDTDHRERRKTRKDNSRGNSTADTDIDEVNVVTLRSDFESDALTSPDASSRRSRTIEPKRDIMRNHFNEHLGRAVFDLKTCVPSGREYSSAELVYGTSLRVPGQFDEYKNQSSRRSDSKLFEAIDNFFKNVKFPEVNVRTNRPTFVPKDLKTCTHVFMRIDATRSSLEPMYRGPFKIVHRSPSNKAFTIMMNGKHKTVSIDRLKAAHMPIADLTDMTVDSNLDQLPLIEDPNEPQFGADRRVPSNSSIPIATAYYENRNTRTSRSGRAIRPPRYNIENYVRISILLANKA